MLNVFFAITNIYRKHDHFLKAQTFIEFVKKNENGKLFRKKVFKHTHCFEFLKNLLKYEYISIVFFNCIF